MYDRIKVYQGVGTTLLKSTFISIVGYGNGSLDHDTKVVEG